MKSPFAVYPKILVEKSLSVVEKLHFVQWDIFRATWYNPSSRHRSRCLLFLIFYVFCSTTSQMCIVIVTVKVNGNPIFDTSVRAAGDLGLYRQSACRWQRHKPSGSLTTICCHARGFLPNGRASSPSCVYQILLYCLATEAYVYERPS